MVCNFFSFVVPYSVDNIADSKPNSKTFIGMTIYRPTDSSAEYFYKVEELIATIDSLDKESYILGDFNCNWFRSADPKTRRLKTFCDLYQLSQLINYSSYWFANRLANNSKRGYNIVKPRLFSTEFKRGGPWLDQKFNDRSVEWQSFWCHKGINRVYYIIIFYITAHFWKRV